MEAGNFLFCAYGMRESPCTGTGIHWPKRNKKWNGIKIWARLPLGLRDLDSGNYSTFGWKIGIDPRPFRNLFKKPRQADNLRKYKIKQIPKIDILYSWYSRNNKKTTASLNIRNTRCLFSEFVLFCLRKTTLCPYSSRQAEWTLSMQASRL